MTPIIQTLWATDFDALQAKIKSAFSFFAFVVATCSMIANALPKYEKIARPKLRWVCKQLSAVVAFGALNWRRHITRIGEMKDTQTNSAKDVRGYD